MGSPAGRGDSSGGSDDEGRGDGSGSVGEGGDDGSGSEGEGGGDGSGSEGVGRGDGSEGEGTADGSGSAGDGAIDGGGGKGDGTIDETAGTAEEEGCAETPKADLVATSVSNATRQLAGISMRDTRSPNLVSLPKEQRRSRGHYRFITAGSAQDHKTDPSLKRDMQ